MEKLYRNTVAQTTTYFTELIKLFTVISLTILELQTVKQRVGCGDSYM